MKAKIDLSLVEPRTLLLAIMFSFIWGFRKQLDPIIPIILHDFYDYSAAEIGATLTFLNGILYLQVILLFAAFFYICSQNFINKIGSTIISAIIGNVIGFWAGFLSSAGCVMYLIPTMNVAPFASVNSSLGWEVVSLLVYEFAAIAGAFLVNEWDRKLKQVGFTAEDVKRPGAVLVVFILYVISGLALLFSALLFTVSDHLMSGLMVRLNIFAVLAFLINGVAGLAVGYGLYAGKRWGWLFAFILSITGVVVSINWLIVHIQNMTGKLAELWMLIGLIIALLVNLIILVCLLLATTRKYFRFLNFESGQNQ